MAAEAGQLCGREGLLEATREILGSARWVTLFGHGGMGKTRLATELARQDDALFVRLERVHDADGVLPAVLAALGAGGRTGPILARIVEVLDRRGIRLLVLDNLEQLLPHAREPFQRLLDRTSCTVLATSRRLVGLREERVVEVPPLDPAASRSLFLDRVPSLALQPVTPGPALDRLLGLLEGVPLAIELAAPRLEILTLDALCDQLQATLALLRRPEAPDDGTSARHHSLQAALDWSWSLLQPGERDVLARLTAFRGGIPVEAVAEVLALEPVEALDLLQRLRRRSWIRPEPGVPARFTMLDTIRAFLVGKVPDEVAVRDRERHAHWFADHGYAWRSESGSHFANLDRLVLELDNLLAARSYCLDHPSETARVQASALMDALVLPLLRFAPFEHTLGLFAPVAHPMETLPARPACARMLRSLAQMLTVVGRLDEALATLDHAASLAAPIGDPALDYYVATLRWTLQIQHGRVDEGLVSLEQLVRTARAAPDEARARGFWAATLAYLGRLDEAEAVLLDAETAAFLPARVEMAWHRGDLEAARGYSARCLEAGVGPEVSRRVFGLAVQHCALHLLCDGPTRARSAVDELLAQPPGPLSDEPRLLLALVHLALGRIDEAAAALPIADDRRASPQHRTRLALSLLGRVWIDVERESVGSSTPVHLDRARELVEAVPFLASPVVFDWLQALDGSVRAGQPTDVLREMGTVRLPYFADLLRAAVAEGVARVDRRRALIRVASDGTWFQLPGEDPVDLSGRSSLAGIVRALLAADAPLAVADLVDAGWPGEELVPRSARNRVYVAVNTLRKLGLTTLARDDDGYRLTGVRRSYQKL